ncbi:MAG TPA: DEAD/DEAH box helicase [Symbiobacteriaceae bacterium]|nr:DEAD/DEAH box helicase [Symbiobacteriaceae bacterium]
MITIHGSFVPAGATGFFFIWGLDSERPAGAKVRTRQAHPQALAAEQLYWLVRGIPSVSSLSCTQSAPFGDAFVSVAVPGIALSVPVAAQWLLDLDTVFRGRPARPGQSIKAWSVAAKLLLELLARGRVLPVLRSEAGCITSGWSLCATDPEDAGRLARLERAIPDACRLLVPPDRDYKAYGFPPASALLHQFMQVAAGGLATAFLRSEGIPEVQQADDHAVRHWLAALAGSADPDLPPGLAGAREVFAVLDTWAAPLTGVMSHASLRSGLRLVPPDKTEDGNWEVELILQTAADPIVTVPAAAAWVAAGEELLMGDQRYRHAEQRLLTDLPAMVRLFPSLAPFLAEVAPERMPVPDLDVLALLESGAAALQQAGFVVLLPEGLVRASALKLRMHLSPPAGARETQFGLHQIINVRWDAALGDATLTMEELRHLAQQKRPLLRVSGRWLQVDERSLAAALRNISHYGEQVELGTALRLMPEVESASAEGWVGALLERLREPGRVEPLPVPQGFVGTLRPYQERGLAWLAFLRRFGLGACLADDMGLGKTIQLIALLLHERETGLATGPTLLVCPVSVVGNWRRELGRFAPSLRVLVHHGSGREEGEAFIEQALASDVVITTYSLVGRDAEVLAKVAWNGLVADEAQNLKNPATQHARALHTMPGGYRIAMTGTPVENQLEDLWSIFRFLNPGLLGGVEEFRRAYALPIERYHDAEAAARLRRHVGPFILRRLKSDPTIVADLPEKLENAVSVTLSVEQAALYEAAVQETLERAAAAEGIQRHGAVLAGLTRLKQICNHPAAVGGSSPLVGHSGKLERLAEMLREVLDEGDQALIFTQFAQFGARLQQLLSRQLGCTVLFLDGSTPQAERDRLIARFQAGEAPLFVLSLKAGGVGINLTAATHVFHVDRWWNPAVEDQATDRAYRIGQTRRVMVYKLVTAGTLEERIDKLLTEKRALSDQVIGTGEAWLSSLSTEELRALITLEREG